jgi:hypothetical protein
MTDGIIAALVTVGGTVLAAAVTYLFTKRKELESRWQEEKLSHYRELLCAISDLAGSALDEANARFARATNTIALVAPQYVIKALMAFYEEIKLSNPNRCQSDHDRLLNELLLAIRKDIGRAKGDNPTTFEFHLIAPGPGKAQDEE